MVLEQSCWVAQVGCANSLRDFLGMSTVARLCLVVLGGGCQNSSGGMQRFYPFYGVWDCVLARDCATLFFFCELKEGFCEEIKCGFLGCLLYTSPSPRD